MEWGKKMSIFASTIQFGVLSFISMVFKKAVLFIVYAVTWNMCFLDVFKLLIVECNFNTIHRTTLDKLYKFLHKEVLVISWRENMNPFIFSQSFIYLNMLNEVYFKYMQLRYTLRNWDLPYRYIHSCFWG